MIKPAIYDELDQSQRQYLRGEYVKAQSGKCHYCNAPLSGQPPDAVAKKRIDWRRFPRNFLRYPVHLHHSHDTGLTIGAVHARCNAVLWQYHGE